MRANKLLFWFLPLVLACTTAVRGEPADATYFFEIALRNEAQDVILSTPVDIGDVVIYSYVHSADKTPVEQVFVIEADLALHLKAERYAWYGAGLETGSGLDLEVSFEDGMVSVTGYNRSFSALLMRVARTVPQEFVVNDRRFLLSDIARGGDPLVIYISAK